MIRRWITVLWLLGLACLAGGSGTVVVTTSLLEAAVRDYGTALPEGMEIVTLIPPGSCPGHFDLSPRALPLLQRASLVLRHDFQQGLDGQMRKLGGDSLRIEPIPAKGSLLVPANYAAMSAAVEQVLAELWPDQAQALQARQVEIAKEVTTLGESVLSKERPWLDAPVIASQQQQAFCAWLGLKVVATLARPDDTSPRQLAELLKTDAVLVVGNLQSDAQAARALAERKGIPVAVFSNFPATGENGYTNLIAANRKELEAAWQAHSQR